MGPFLCGEGMDPEAIFSLHKIPGKKAPCADCRGYPGAYADGKYQRGRTAACNGNRKKPDEYAYHKGFSGAIP